MQQRPRIEGNRNRREPRSTDEARRAITETRNRISRDLDVIEDRIVQTRQEWRSRMDVLTPARRRVRDNLWPSLGIALGTGFVLGAIGGGGKEAESIDDRERERRRRWRAKRRERLQERHREAGQRHERPSRGRIGPSRTAMLAGAIMSGLRTRMKRVGRDLLVGRR